MATQRTDILTGIIIEEEARLSLRELCDACAVHVEFITELVDEGVIDPEDMDLFWYAETPDEIWQGILRWHAEAGTMPACLESCGA